MYTLFRTARPETIPCLAPPPRKARIGEYLPPPPGRETPLRSGEGCFKDLKSVAMIFVEFSLVNSLRETISLREKRLGDDFFLATCHGSPHRLLSCG